MKLQAQCAVCALQREKRWEWAEDGGDDCETGTGTETAASIAGAGANLETDTTS